MISDKTKIALIKTAPMLSHIELIELVVKECEIASQRTWVGLTNNELQPIADEYRILFGSWVEDFARAIEAKFKEKNV